MAKITPACIVVTGAAGYLGRRVVSRAIASGLRVRAVVRPGRSLEGIPWVSDKKVEVLELDLSDETADLGLLMGEKGAGIGPAIALVHSAGIIMGSKSEHSKINVAPIRRLVEAMQDTDCGKLVHLGSVSVFGYASLPDDSQIDEFTPLELDTEDRDNYCQAKCEQEAILVQLAQAGKVQATVLRPGVICGYENAWTARLGIRKAGLLLQFNGKGRIPISFVDHCAEAVILAVQRNNFKSDVCIDPALENTGCGFEAINIVEDDLPTQDEYLQLLARANKSGYKRCLRIPWRLSSGLINLVSWLKVFSPPIYRRIPLLGRKATFCARMKGLRYCNARLHDRLGWEPQSNWIDAIHKSWIEEE